MKLTRQAASDAVTPHGWRLVLRALRCHVPAGSLAALEELMRQAGDSRLHIDLRPDGALLTLQSATGEVTTAETALATRISATVPTRPAGTRPVQALEIAIDALDIPAIRPFWKAVLAYHEDDDGALSDPHAQGPTIWFQQMTTPRPQRNRIHLDVSVPHDEAPRRIEAAIQAGGRLLNATEAPSFWVLADPEGNEACITTWQARD